MEETFQSALGRQVTLGVLAYACACFWQKKTVESRRCLYHGDVYSGENGFLPCSTCDLGLGRKLARPRYTSTAPTEPSDST